MIRRIMTILLAIAMIAPIAMPQVNVADVTTVSQAKTYKTSRKALYKKLNKLGEEISVKKVKKSLKRSLGKPYNTIEIQDGSGTLKKYVLRYYLTDKATAKIWENDGYVIKNKIGVADVYFTFRNGKLDYWSMKVKLYFPEDEEPPISYEE